MTTRPATSIPGETAWGKLSPDEKMEKRFAAWLSAPDIDFASPQAEAEYKARVTRFKDAIQLKKTPDRVPIWLNFFGIGTAYCGYTAQEAMYDVDKDIEVGRRCTIDFQTDTTLGMSSNARAMEILDYRLFSWPGHGVDINSGLQFNEGEYMHEDEYDDFIEDPTDFWWRFYLPRVVGALEPLKTLPRPSYHYATIPANLSQYGRPEIMAALQKLHEAGQVSIAWQQKLAKAGKELQALGFPSMAGAPVTGSAVPFDITGDALRGTCGIIRDMFRQPDKLLWALDRFTSQWIRRMKRDAVKVGGCPIVSFMLHKGSDGYMSNEQFKKFYWPTMRRQIVALAEEGFVVRLFAEGTFDSRLEIISDVPKGKTIWYFDYTDMARAKEILGDIACIMGNVPVALMTAGTPEETSAYCRRLIDVAGKDGGFIMATGAGIDRNGKVENVRAMIETTKEYGIYR